MNETDEMEKKSEEVDRDLRQIFNSGLLGCQCQVTHNFGNNTI